MNYSAITNYNKDINHSNATFNLVQYLAKPVAENARLIGGVWQYRSGDAAILQINITKDGSFYDPANITVNATTSALALIQTHYYPGDIVRTGTGRYYSKTIVNSSQGVAVRWDVYVSNDSYASYIISAVQADRDVISANGLINASLVNASQASIPSANITIYDRNNYILGSRNASWTRDASLDDKYRVDLSYGNQSFVVHGLNVTANTTVAAQFVENYNTTNLGAAANLSNIFSLNATSLAFDNATIILAKNSLAIDRICRCEAWNMTAAACSGNWQCNNTGDYDYGSNSTHFWFNATSFSGYAGGVGFNANLTIWDSRDAQGGSNAVYTGEQARFYAKNLKK